MRIKAATPVHRLLARYPESEAILSWYRVALDRDDTKITIADLCAGYGLDEEDVLVELGQLIEGPRGED